MDKIYNSKHIVKGLFWKFAERSGVQGMQFIVQIILARLLLPKDYGILAIAMIFILISNVFIQNGVSSSLIQKKNTSNLDYSTAFWISFVTSIFIYTLLFLFSPQIASFFNEKELENFLKIIGINIIIGSIHGIQISYISKNMLFQKLFYASTISVISSGVLAITLAFLNFGIWSLIIYQLLNQILIVILLKKHISWKLEYTFSKKSALNLYSFGWKLMVASLIDNLYTNLRSILIGKSYSSSTLGLFTRGIQFPELLATNINGSIQTVMFPALASNQDNKEAFKNLVRKSIIVSSFVVFPLMIILATVANPLIVLLLTDKWIEVVPILQIYCAVFVLLPIHTANLQAINALGRSDIFLKMEILKKIIGVSIILLTYKHGIIIFCYGAVLTSLISSLINIFPSKKLFNYSYKEQFLDLIPIVSLTFIVGVFIQQINFFESPLLVILSKTLIGIIMYVSLAFIFKIKALFYIIKTFKILSIRGD